MPMTLVVTRSVPDRVRGFLSSCMCEIAPGVYVAPSMTAGVRNRLRSAVVELGAREQGGSVTMTWPDRNAPGGLQIWNHGVPRVEICDIDGIHLVRHNLPKAPEPRSDN